MLVGVVRFAALEGKTMWKASYRSACPGLETHVSLLDRQLENLPELVFTILLSPFFP